jgi:hypothetical protein
LGEKKIWQLVETVPLKPSRTVSNKPGFRNRDPVSRYQRATAINKVMVKILMWLNLLIVFKA